MFRLFMPDLDATSRTWSLRACKWLIGDPVTKHMDSRPEAHKTSPALAIASTISIDRGVVPQDSKRIFAEKEEIHCPIRRSTTLGLMPEST